MAAYDTGYEDERFQHPVGHTLHCGICMNVLKDPVMCRQNEHLYCRACIIPHLMNSQTCPTCMEPLTVETLRQASRGIRSLLAELKIRCEFYDRGCREFIELGNLESHLRDCGFAPAVCSNEGCRLEVNQRDLLHHETSVCELRRVQCHSCNDIKQEMDTLKVSLAAMNEKLDGNKKELAERLEENRNAIDEKVIAKVNLVQEQLHEQEESIRRVEADNVEIVKSVHEITKQLGGMTQTLREVQAEQTRKGIAETALMSMESKVVIAGGENKNRYLKSVEMFKLSNRTWIPLQPLRECHYASSSFVHNNHIFVSGGYASTAGTKSMETLPLNAVHINQAITWEKFAGELPSPLHRHCSVVYNGQLIMIGGYRDDKCTLSDSITEVSLVPPYTSKLLATMPQTRWYHGVALFDDKVLIVGGLLGMSYRAILKTVLLYNITKNECQELAPLPYGVCEAATVEWGDGNILIVGGGDSNGKSLNKVLLYNIKIQKSYELPDMKYKRRGCVAAVIRDTVIVMGGKDEEGNYLKSVESFRFDRYSWQELPEMCEGRYCATAIVC